MNAKTIATALATLAAAAVPVAVAAPPPDQSQGKAKKTAVAATATCKPYVALILRGTLESDPRTGDPAVQMKVTSADRHGKPLVGETVTLTIGQKTIVKRSGKGKLLGALAMGDRANAHLRWCKGLAEALAETSTPALFAKQILARPAKTT